MSDSTAQNNKGAGMAIAALILGIVAVLSSFIPLAGIFLVWAPAIVGLILGIIGLTGGRPSRVLALVGVILSGLSIILVIIFTSVALGAVSSAINDSSVSTSEEVATGEETAAAGSTYVYEITGDGGTANVTYSSYSNGGFSSQSANGTPIPFTYEGTIEEGGIFDYTSLSLLAIGTDSTTTLTCKITVDGEVVSENTSTGAYATVMCSQSGTN